MNKKKLFVARNQTTADTLAEHFKSFDIVTFGTALSGRGYETIIIAMDPNTPGYAKFVCYLQTKLFGSTNKVILI